MQIGTSEASSSRAGGDTIASKAGKDDSDRPANIIAGDGLAGNQPAQVIQGNRDTNDEQ